MLIAILVSVGNCNQSKAADILEPYGSLIKEWKLDQTQTLRLKDAKYRYCLSQDGSECWIRAIDPYNPKKTLKIPGEINGIPVTRIGRYSRDEEELDLWDNVTYSGADRNLFGIQLWRGYEKFPNSVKNSKKIKKIVVPDSVRVITRCCFAKLENLEEVVLPKELKILHGLAFMNSKKLKKVVIPAGTEQICTGAFVGCDSLKKIEVEKNGTHYRVYKGCLLSKDKTVFYGPTQDADTLKIPKGVREMQAITFPQFSVKTLKFPETLWEIGEHEYVIGEGTTCVVNKKNPVMANIGKHVYNKLTGELQIAAEENGVVNIPKGIKKLRRYVIFSGDEDVRKVVIPKTVKSIDDCWFQNFPRIRDIEFHFLGKKPPKLVGEYPHTSLETAKYYVPKKSFKKYKKWLKENLSFPEDCTVNGKDVKKIKRY